VFIVFSCLGLISCRGVYFSVSFGFVYSHDIFRVEGFAYKDQIEELFTVMVYCMYSQQVTSSTFELISLF